MNTTFDNGAIAVNAKMFEQVGYDTSNNLLSARFNGKGGIDYYAVTDGETLNIPVRFMSISHNGEKQDVLLGKTVRMLGRRQTLEFDLKNALLKVEQILPIKENRIYLSFELISENPGDTAEVSLCGELFAKCEVSEGNMLTGDDKLFAAEASFEYIADNEAVYFALSAKNPRAYMCLSFQNASDAPFSPKKDFEAAMCELNEELEAIKLPSGLNETEKALFYSAYYASLENYKEKGEYKAFMAGCRYLSPMRSYYRDSYYTVLPMYNGHTDKVKEQIITLARGISADGSCPSAVRSDFSAWWGNHYDSPSFLSMMLGDYIRFTGDIEFADFKIDGCTVLEKAVAALEHLSSYADETGLIFKEGRTNKRDWADEVNRYGYVTYVELMYARALYSLAKIYALKGDTIRAEHYSASFRTVKDAINKLLWSDKQGYYVNFTNEDYTEDNLSIDTVFAAIFGIADAERSKTMLLNMERILESKNNGVEIDFGSMCVYPFYKHLNSASRKSTQSFNYHNGANWPYLSAMYAYAKRKFGMEYKSLLTTPFEYNIGKGNYTQIEYFSPYCEDGSMLQAWSGATAFVLDEEASRNFF